MDRGHKARLNAHTAPRFDGGDFFSEVARTVCRAECLPRKELFESWAVARRLQRHLKERAYGRVVDLCCGHGLLGALTLLLVPRWERALLVDTRLPTCGARVLESLTDRWPRLQSTVETREADLEDAPLLESDLVVSAHACGLLTDRVIARAIAAGADVAVLPCCTPNKHDDADAYSAWTSREISVDVRRAERLRAAGYRVRATTIPVDITPQNRLLIATRSAGESHTRNAPL